jgi:hypothetical protein
MELGSLCKLLHLSRAHAGSSAGQATDDSGSEVRALLAMPDEPPSLSHFKPGQRLKTPRQLSTEVDTEGTSKASADVFRNESRKGFIEKKMAGKLVF